MALAVALHGEGKRKEMLPHVQRALDLAARFDYEYWLREQIKQNPVLFYDEEVIELLPLDLRAGLEEEKRRKGENNRKPKTEDQRPIYKRTNNG